MGGTGGGTLVGGTCGDPVLGGAGGDPSAGACTRAQIALGQQLRVALLDQPARDAQLARAQARARKAAVHQPAAAATGLSPAARARAGSRAARRSRGPVAGAAWGPNRTIEPARISILRAGRLMAPKRSPADASVSARGLDRSMSRSPGVAEPERRPKPSSDSGLWGPMHRIHGRAPKSARHAPIWGLVQVATGGVHACRRTDATTRRRDDAATQRRSDATTPRRHDATHATATARLRRGDPAASSVGRVARQLRGSAISACAAAILAIGTRNGEQET